MSNTTVRFTGTRPRSGSRPVALFCADDFTLRDIMRIGKTSDADSILAPDFEKDFSSVGSAKDRRLRNSQGGRLRGAGQAYDTEGLAPDFDRDFGSLRKLLSRRRTVPEGRSKAEVLDERPPPVPPKPGNLTRRMTEPLSASPTRPRSKSAHIDLRKDPHIWLFRTPRNIRDTSGALRMGFGSRASTVSSGSSRRYSAGLSDFEGEKAGSSRRTSSSTVESVSTGTLELQSLTSVKREAGSPRILVDQLLSDEPLAIGDGLDGLSERVVEALHDQAVDKSIRQSFVGMVKPNPRVVVQPPSSENSPATGLDGTDEVSLLFGSAHFEHESWSGAIDQGAAVNEDFPSSRPSSSGSCEDLCLRIRELEYDDPTPTEGVEDFSSSLAPAIDVTSLNAGEDSSSDYSEADESPEAGEDEGEDVSSTDSHSSESSQSIEQPCSSPSPCLPAPAARWIPPVSEKLRLLEREVYKRLPPTPRDSCDVTSYETTGTEFYG